MWVSCLESLVSFTIGGNRDAIGINVVFFDQKIVSRLDNLDGFIASMSANGENAVFADLDVEVLDGHCPCFRFNSCKRPYSERLLLRLEVRL